MHTYRKVERAWAVGYWLMAPTNMGGARVTEHINSWTPVRVFEHERDAASYANYLNGGAGDYYTEGE
jgi:hypothetical protein